MCEKKCIEPHTNIPANDNQTVLIGQYQQLMSESSYHSNHRDRYPASHHRHHHRDRSRGYERREYQDDRESGRSDRSQKRVPGHVSDPEKEENESDSVIGRGQRETVDRYASSKYRRTNSGDKKGKSSAKDNLSSSGNMSPYDGNLATITQPAYYKRNDFDGKKSRVCNAVLLSFLPGLVGVGCILAAIILIDWMNQVNNDMVVTFGLFQVCSQQIPSGGGVREAPSCQSSESFASAGSELSSLEQATRGLIIIAALIGFISMVCSVIFGFNRFHRKWGALVVGGLYAFSGAVAIAAMGTYSSFLSTQFTQLSETETILVTGGSFYLGWFGTACFVVGSITAFVGHCV